MTLLLYFFIATMVASAAALAWGFFKPTKEDDCTHDDFQEWNDRMDAISDFYMQQPLMKDANKSWDEYSARNHKGRRL